MRGGRALPKFFGTFSQGAFLVNKSTVSKRVLILRTWSLIRTFLAFWVLNGSLFIFQGPYFHYFGSIHAKNVNSVSYLQALVPVYTVGKF